MDIIDAIKNNDIDNLKLLLNSNNINNKYDNGNTALILAVMYNNKDIVELLLEHNADVNIRNKWDNTALFLAIIYNNKDIVELLLKYNADLNIQNRWGCTALIRAVYIGDKILVELLLKYNVDVNIQDYDSETALIIANKYNLYDIKQLLLNHLYKCAHIINIYTLTYHHYYDINMSNIIYGYIKN